MDTLTINQHSIAGWKPYADQFGFVPDPMILRASEIYLNGLTGAAKLQRKDFEVWRALEQNVGGLVDFFDLVVTQDVIPFINYWDSFDRMSLEVPLDEMLGVHARRVEIDHAVYNEVKKGALVDLARLDFTKLAAAPVSHMLSELDAFRYEWKPRLDVDDVDPALDAPRAKFKGLGGETFAIAQFLLGGLIFGGFAKGGTTVHHIQPKRARYYLGLTAAPEKVQTLSADEESAIFDTAEQSLKGSQVEAQRREAIPPVLPYLLRDPMPKTPRALLDRALEFRWTREGNDYRTFVQAVRGDGIQSARSMDKSKKERERALAFLAPYTNIDPEKSASLDISVPTDLAGMPGGSVSFNLRAPIWLQIWWNDYVPFGGVRKTLRRMWMAKESYQDLCGKLRGVWASA